LRNNPKGRAGWQLVPVAVSAVQLLYGHQHLYLAICQCYTIATLPLSLLLNDSFSLRKDSVDSKLVSNSLIIAIDIDNDHCLGKRKEWIVMQTHLNAFLDIGDEIW
jgi:hypothetical protein